MIDIKNFYSKDRLRELGLLSIATREQMKDKILENENPLEEDELNNFIKNWSKKNNLNNDFSFNNFLSQRGIEEYEFKHKLIRDLKWTKWCTKNFKKDIKPYFAKTKQKFDKIIYSIIRVKKKGLADELFLRINESEESFEEIAKIYSEGKERESGGRMGPVLMDKPHPKLVEYLLSNNQNQLLPPLKIGNFWLISRLEKYIKIDFNEEIINKIALELGEKYLIEKCKN